MSKRAASSWEGKPVRAIPTETYFSMVRQMLLETGQAYVRVTGKSMKPLLHHLRDGVIIGPPDQIRIGDIVLFDRKNGRYALHRVIRKKENLFSMMGDNQWQAEHDLPIDQVVGVVREIVRKERRIPCTNVFIVIYAHTEVILALPRICIRKSADPLIRMLCGSGKSHKEGKHI